MNHETIEQYRHITGGEPIEQLYQLAKPLSNIKLVHVNSTASGGGVAEILYKFVPLSSALGIETRWEVIEGNAEFFDCTKKFHNAMQGNKVLPSTSSLQVFEEVNRKNAERLKDILENADVVIIHDPQPLPLIRHFPHRKGKWIWRCHIDASNPYKPVWNYLKPFIEEYDATIFSMAEFTHPLSKPMFIIPPSIDPLSEKNMDLEKSEIDKVYETFGLDPKRPLVLQVSRFDHFKDPVGVVEAYRLAKKYGTDIQLVLAGSSAPDDPEGEMVYNEVKNISGNDPDVHLLLLPGNAHRTINALQRAADIIIQKSVREGFGLTVTEALWKGKPVIGGNTGGIKLQVIHAHTGYIVNTPEGAAYRIRYLLQHPNVCAILGKAAKEYVREKFLITRQLREYYTLIYSLLFKETDRIELPPSSG